MKSYRKSQSEEICKGKTKRGERKRKQQEEEEGGDSWRERPQKLVVSKWSAKENSICVCVTLHLE